MRLATVTAALGLVIGIASGAGAQDGDVLVNMRDLSSYELRSEGFVLSAPQSLRVAATGASQTRSGWFGRDERGQEWPGNAWILNARTREVVWELRTAGARTRKNVERYQGEVELPAGEYEAYFASYTSIWQPNGINLRTLIGRRGDRRDDGGLSEEFALTIHGKGQRMAPAELQRARDGFRGTAVVRLNSGRRQEAEQMGFELTRPTTVEIYAVGELNDGGAFDSGWIVNATTLEKVWEFDYSGSRPAGGSRKNRQVHESVKLPAGKYAAIFTMDDSHDPREWNAAPPYDPAYWGMTLRVKPEDRAAVQTFAFDPTPDNQAIASVNRVRSHETRSYGFTLTKPLAVRVYALGEGRDGEMFDYGWIIDAASRKRVWVMEYDRTQHAGGADKNRRVNEVIQIEAGSYVVYYRTDDSHAFREWNSSAPIGGDDWGISLFPASGTLDRSILAAFRTPAEDTADLIARITGVGDEQARSRTFRLDSDTEVRIHALGEGMDGEMFDYAWIENLDTGRRVWEMAYARTQHAGGSQKNRLYEGTLFMPAGEYVLRYKSDGSHSPDSWNADPPYDPAMWGVRLSRVTPKK